MHGHLWSSRAFSGGPSFGVGELRERSHRLLDLGMSANGTVRRREAVHVIGDARAEHRALELQGKRPKTTTTTIATGVIVGVLILM